MSVETLQELATRLDSKEKQLKQIEADYQRQYDNMLSSVREKCKKDLDEISKREAEVLKKEKEVSEKDSSAKSLSSEAEVKLSESRKKEKLIVETSDALEKKRLFLEHERRDLDNRKAIFEAEAILKRSSIENSRKTFDEYREKVEKSLSSERARLADLATELEKKITDVSEDKRVSEKAVLESQELKRLTADHVKREAVLIEKLKKEAEGLELETKTRSQAVSLREKIVLAKELSVSDREKKIQDDAEHNRKWSLELELRAREVKILETKVGKLIELNKLEADLGIKK